jgi:NAD(P)H-hydrate repair Nnr-like enzyme with NAD(P)H-hydrate dehydratase domain
MLQQAGSGVRNNTVLDKLIKIALASGKLPAQPVALSNAGQLHKLAANLLNNRNGTSIDALDISHALNELGKNIYIKRAEWGMVTKGLQALEAIKENK